MSTKHNVGGNGLTSHGSPVTPQPTATRYLVTPAQLKSGDFDKRRLWAAFDCSAVARLLADALPGAVSPQHKANVIDGQEHSAVVLESA